jgi:hypothetical protein
MSSDFSCHQTSHVIRLQMRLLKSDDTFSLQQYYDIISHLAHQGTDAAIRNRSIFTHLFACVGRADEGRLLFMPDIMAPRVISCIGELSMTDL